MARDLTQLELLQELVPTAEDNVNRHISMAREWHWQIAAGDKP